MRNRVIICVILSFTALYYTSCTTDKLTPVEIDCIGDAPVWDGEVDDIVALTCAYAECHISGTSASGNYLSYNGINSILTNGKFKNRVFDIKDNPTLGMPPDNSAGPKELSEEQLNTLSCWMEAGFPEN